MMLSVVLGPANAQLYSITYLLFGDVGFGAAAVAAGSEFSLCHHRWAAGWLTLSLSLPLPLFLLSIKIVCMEVSSPGIIFWHQRKRQLLFIFPLIVSNFYFFLHVFLSFRTSFLYVCECMYFDPLSSISPAHIHYISWMSRIPTLATHFFLGDLISTTKFPQIHFITVM